MAALESVASLFEFARALMHKHGHDALCFADLTTAMLNGPLRPFTARWHPISKSGALCPGDASVEFRRQLTELQGKLIPFARALRSMAREDGGEPLAPDWIATSALEEPQSSAAWPVAVGVGDADWLAAETAALKSRREGRGHESTQLLGVALSGGGVRSASSNAPATGVCCRTL
ncbi:MAG: hypothetical protein AB8H80_19250 [Planctomycetota bacterium]